MHYVLSQSQMVLVTAGVLAMIFGVGSYRSFVSYFGIAMIVGTVVWAIFAAALAAIRDRGKFIRCGNCRHVWRQGKSPAGSNKTENDVWGRYSENARQAVWNADSEAGRRGHDQVTTDHLLRGLLLVHGCGGLTVLNNLGIDPKDLYQNALENVTPREASRALSEGGKLALFFAAEEADRFQSRTIGTEHLLLGILRQGVREPRIAQLRKDLDLVRQEVAGLRRVMPETDLTSRSQSQGVD